MKHVDKHIDYLLEDIQRSKDKAALLYADSHDDLINQIITNNIEIKTARDFPHARKKPIRDITGIDTDKLMPSLMLSYTQRSLLAVELTNLLNDFHLYLDFPPAYPDYLRYKYIRQIWNDKYPVLKNEFCYITMCDYNWRNCPFPKYCNLCYTWGEEIEWKSNDKLIPYISKYCDRWCTKCEFTANCKSFQIDKTFEKSIMANENLNIQEDIIKSSGPVKEVVAAAYGPASGEVIRSKSNYLDFPEYKDNRLIREARSYGLCSYEWLKQHNMFFESKKIMWEYTGCLENVAESLDKLRWYSLFICSRLINAQAEYDRLSRINEPNRDELQRFQPLHNDVNGMAKVAMIAIDQSLNAWQQIRNYLPEVQKDIELFSIQLDQIKSLADEHFPGARQFKRPGLDDNTSL